MGLPFEMLPLLLRSRIKNAVRVAELVSLGMPVLLVTYKPAV